MIALLGLLLLHLVGSLLRVVTTRVSLKQAIARPSSVWFAIVAAYCASLGWAGLVLAVALFVVSRAGLTPLPDPLPLRRGEVVGFLLLSALVLARPWVPTQWDEFVWIAKARLEAVGFGEGVRAALDASLNVLPTGYPPLWPSAIGWLSLHADDIDADTLSGSLLMLVCVATLIEVWREEPVSIIGLAVVFASPLIWVHLRSTYVDLPVGLLSAALAVCLVRSHDRPPFIAVLLGVVLAAFKDEGLLHVFAASFAALLTHGWRRWRFALPALAALITAGTWKVLLRVHEIGVFDHSVNLPAWSEAPHLLALLGKHLFDLHSWGVFWALTFAAAVLAGGSPMARGLRVTLVGLFVVTFFAILAGPERVRVFADNGTLLNRLLLQLWPCAALLVLSTWLSPARRDAPAPPAAPASR
ncbi:MAG: hypothetical protein DI536_12625 [Archangium gephyra]|uniref:Glycosyltransferase RgtA/B/C/D-like domain-containing protein n=1 Tax=Archangium gephyra TaxID=48 RepID=A0A2W5TIF0_9BACT|nr:MAG: hypothetical protein DI536_12625 [Archangium gephyra]